MARLQPVTPAPPNPRAALIEDFWKGQGHSVFPNAISDECEQWIVFVRGRRVRLEGRQIWRSKAAAAGAVHRALKAARFRGERFSYDQRAALIEDNVEFQRLS